jgi:NADPH:quinone reductase
MTTTAVSTARGWQVVRYGAPSEALELVTLGPLVPGPDQVKVRVAASVLNYNEVDGCRGRYLTINPPIPYTLGLEFVGEVIDAGPGAEHWIGHRIVGTATNGFGAHAEEVLGDARMAFDAPEELSDVDAAAFYYPFHLAHLGLFERGQLQAGETVLIHAAAGGVGSAAVQLAKAAGARVIATAGGPAKLDFVRELGADVVIDYRGGFRDAVLEATDNEGVDVCFDGVGGDVMMESLPLLKRNGRHLIIGFASGIEAEEVPMVTGRMFCFGNYSVVGVILAYGNPVAPGSGFNPTPYDIAERMHNGLVDMLKAGTIRTLVTETVPFEELPKALDRMEDRSTMGRVVVQIGKP